MDSVIVDLTKTWFDRFNEDHALQIGDNGQRVTDFNFGELTPAEQDDLFSYLDEPSFFRHLEPIPGAIEVLEELNRLHEVVIVTTCPNIIGINTAPGDKAAWLHDYCPFLRPVKKQLVLTSRKDVVQGTLLFDDAPHNLIRVPGRLSVAMDYPYNRHVVTDFRVYNRDWTQFYDVVEMLSNGAY